MRDSVRAQLNAAGVPQRLDAPIVGNHVAELNDFRYAAEMLDEAGCAAEGLARQIVNGDLTVVEMGVGNAREVLENEVLDDAEILSDGRGTNLFMVSNDEHGLAQIQRDESHNVTLAGFINDDDVETSGAGIKIFDNARQRHDPNRNGAAALAHFTGGLGAKQGDADTMAFADAATGVEPADECLTLARGGAAGFRGPWPFFGEFNGGAANLPSK